MNLDELISRLINDKDWNARCAIAEQIKQFNDEAIQPVIEILGLFVHSDDYFLKGSDIICIVLPRIF